MFGFLFTFAALAAPAGAAGDGELARGARAHLLEAAAAAGLEDVELTLRVADTNAPPCNGPVEVVPLDTRYLSRMKFAARCAEAPQRPIRFVARAELAARVVVATARVPAGQPIAAGEVGLARHALRALDTATSDLEAVVGKSSRRALRAGQVVEPPWLTEPLLVHRGAEVSIVANNGGVSVTTTGEALAGGRAGDLIDVRNATTGRVIRARVAARDTVEPAELATDVMPHFPR